MFDRDRIADPARIGQEAFLAFLDEHLVEDADDHAGFGMIQGTAAVSGINGSIQLEHWIRLIKARKQLKV